MSSKLWDNWFKKYNALLPLYRIWDIIEINKYAYLLNGIRLNNSKALELGCGSGILTRFLIRKFGVDATLVDYSSEAIRVARENLRGKNVKFLKENILNLKLDEKFDIVHSQGLIEHFKGEQQIEVIKKHIEFTKSDGLLLLVVPRISRKYTLWKLCGTVLCGGKWAFGFEEPIDPEWLKKNIANFGLNLIRGRNFQTEFGGLWQKNG